MKRKLRPAFVRMPPKWIQDGGLHAYRWTKGEGVDALAALMVYTALLHNMEPDDGSVRQTYDQLTEATGLARKSVSRGLSAAIERKLIMRPDAGRSSFQVVDYAVDKYWAMFPTKSMYSGTIISAFKDFNLRRPAELDWLKFLFLCAARRDRNTNMAHMTHAQIHSLSGIQLHNIKRATSGAAALSLVYTEQLPRVGGAEGVAHGYRVVGVHSKSHIGTMSYDSLFPSTSGDVDLDDIVQTSEHTPRATLEEILGAPPPRAR